MDRQTLGEMDLPAHIWEPFAQSRAAIRCSPGFLIYLQGTEATCFYYLKSGQVKSFIQSPDGGERVLNLYQEGSLFGEASFFDELPRVSSAVAMTPCELVPIDRELLSRESLVMQKKSNKSKKGYTEVDLIPLIKGFNLECQSDTLTLDAVLCAQNPGLNPELIRAAFCQAYPEYAPDFVTFHRREVLDIDGKPFR